MRISKYKLAILALILANIIWGATPPIFKWALFDIKPFSFGFLRFFLATLILLPFVIHKVKISMNALIKLAIVAYIGLFLQITYVLFGLQLTQSINAPIIASSAPILIIIGSVIFLKEKTKKDVIVGTIVSLVGVLIIVLMPVLSEGFDGSFLGNIFFILNMVTTVLYTLLLKRFRIHYDSITITFWLFAFTALSFFPFFLWENHTTSIITTLSSRALIGILFSAVFTSVIAYTCYNFALKYISANEVSVFFYVDPIATIIVALPLLGEKITPLYLIGSVLVFLGILVSEKRIPYHPIHKLWR